MTDGKGDRVSRWDKEAREVEEIIKNEGTRTFVPYGDLNF